MGTVCITGGTGSFGQAFTRYLLETGAVDAIRVYSRDEQKQDAMRRSINDPRVRYLLGDVRDPRRLVRALDGCDYVVHAAALKIIPAGEYNPDEVVKTNVMGSHNVIECSIDAGVRGLVCISSDKAVAAVNLYGSTKACMERLATCANAYSGDTRIGVVRYGNVLGSRGSIFTILGEQAKAGALRITHRDMTRFWMSLQDACEFVLRALLHMDGGEIFLPKIRSARVLDLCTALYPGIPIVYTGLRPGEKLHEWLSNEYETLEDAGWAWRIRGDIWRAGNVPLCSANRDILLSADELIALHREAFDAAA